MFRATLQLPFKLPRLIPLGFEGGDPVLSSMFSLKKNAYSLNFTHSLPNERVEPCHRGGGGGGGGYVLINYRVLDVGCIWGHGRVHWSLKLV